MMRLVIWLVGLLGAAPVLARPHVVLFMSDDHSWHDCGAYGAGDVRTPNIDRLAKSGMRFERAFAASPTCTPSRSAIYTACYPVKNGAHANHSLIHDGVRTWPEYFKGLGYRVVLAGKTHIGPRGSFGFEYLAGSNVMPSGKNHVLWTDLHTGAVERLLTTHEREKTPLCLIVCSHSPHVYWPPSEGYEPAKVVLPPYLLDTNQTREVRCRYYTDVTWMDRQVGEVMGAVEKHGYAGETIFVYTADQGAQWPFAKWNLYDAGIRSPLIVRWPGKVKEGAVSGAMLSLVDLLPTLLEACGGEAPKGIDGKSFLPVLLGKADEHREEVYGAHTGDANMNRSPMRCVRTGRWKYILNLAPGNRYETHISRGAGPDGKGYWDSWVKLADADEGARRVVERYHVRPAEELYDVGADPYELKNVAGEAGNARVLADLREKVKAWRVGQGEDLGKVLMPEDARKGEVLYAR
jgi:N-sulfoglucosamine sulfohydrolase